MCDDHAELGRDHVQPLRRLLADHMHGRPAARAVRIFGSNRYIHPRQMTRQRAAIGSTLFGAHLCGYRVLLVVVGFALGNRLLDILKCQEQLVGIELLRAFAEVRTLQLAKQMAQPIDLHPAVPCRRTHRLPHHGR